MRKILIISICILAVLTALFIKLPEPVKNIPEPKPSIIPVNTPKPTPKSAPISGDSVFKRVNNWRKNNGYSEYKESEFACSVAKKRLPQVKKNWSHDGFYYKNFCEDCYLGENLAREFYLDTQASAVVDAWVSSPSHLANLKASYTHGCIKCSEGYCVHILSYQ